MKDDKEMYEYLDWLTKKIEEDESNLDWIGSEDCYCEFENDNRTEEDKEKGSFLINLCEYLKELNPDISEKNTNIYNLQEKRNGIIFLSYPCICFKYKQKYYFINCWLYYGGSAELSIISEREAKKYSFIEL